MSIFEKLKSLGKGAKIKFKVTEEDGIFDAVAVLHAIDWMGESRCNVTVNNCIMKNALQPPNLVIDGEDIISLDVVDPGEAFELKNPTTTEARRGRAIFSKRAKEREIENSHLGGLNNLRIPELLHQVQLNDPPKPEILNDQRGKPRVFPPVSQDAEHMEGDKFRNRHSIEFAETRRRCWPDLQTPPKLDKVPYKYYVIDTQDMFYFAMEILFGKDKVTDRIGVSLEGKFLSRFGELSIVCISNENAAFLFDFLKLGRGLCFGTNNLNFKTAFENPKILKVIHDCRKASDVLFNVYQVKLNNVADTLVRHSILCYQAVYAGYFPRYTFSASHVARVYLGVCSKDLYFPHYRLAHLEEDTAIWMKRPLSSNLEINSIRNVAYLLEIYHLQEIAFKSFEREAVEFMLGYMRDADDVDLRVKMHEEQIVPEEIEGALPKVIPNEDFARQRIGMTENRFVHQAVGQIDQNVIFSRDVMHQKR